MRWDNLLANEDDAGEETGTAVLPLFPGEAIVRRFKTPQFQGMTFYEVAAKSIINHVPGDRFGFNWTINPYRGCSHACAYCLAGETPVLLADGGMRAIQDLAAGDLVYGSVEDGADRRYVATPVLAHWATNKPAYRIHLEDGRELVASGDHRFLTESGWKHVADAEFDKLMAVRSIHEPPSLLGVLAVEPLLRPVRMYDITTGTGDFIANGVISHNCFARPTHTYLDFDAGRDFETKIVVKVNAPDLLRRALRKPTWRGDLIAMGTNTDPYQRAEGHYKLMRGILRELNGARNPYSILTKGTLIQRDLDLLVEGASVTQVAANFSVGTVDEQVWKVAEPGTAHPRKRLEVVAKLNEAGIPCGVLMAPILPGISDRPEQLEATVRAAAEAGATHITPITLHLRPGVKEEFLPWLAEHYPDLVPTYAKLYPKANAPKATGDAIGKAVAGLRRQYGASSRGPTGGRGPNTRQPPELRAELRAESRPESRAEQTVDDDGEQLSMDLGAPGPRKAPGRLLTSPKGTR